MEVQSAPRQTPHGANTLRISQLAGEVVCGAKCITILHERDFLCYGVLAGPQQTKTSHFGILRGRRLASKTFSADQPLRRGRSAVFEFRVGSSVPQLSQYARLADGSLRFPWTVLAISWMHRPTPNYSSTGTSATSPLTPVLRTYSIRSRSVA